MTDHSDESFMRLALDLARRGEGQVEPNPMVGCVIVADGQIVGQGWHEKCGGPHAEIHALRQAGPQAHGATLYVTLEPCAHQGRTGPCTEAIIESGVQRVVAAMRDPFSQVDGAGARQLVAAGIPTQLGLLNEQATQLNAPYQHRIATGRPWVIAKWAMTLDGKIAAHTGQSAWISQPACREIVHQIRGRMDAILVGRGTVEADDPLLTARPPGPRVATRIVLDSKATLASDRQLVHTLEQAPVMVVTGPGAPRESIDRLTAQGCEVFSTESNSPTEQWGELLDELGRREMTNLLVEGGAHVCGSLADAGLIDEVHVFIAPKLVGGHQAASPIGGTGVAAIAQAQRLTSLQVQTIDGDLYLQGRVDRGFE